MITLKWFALYISKKKKEKVKLSIISKIWLLITKEIKMDRHNWNNPFCISNRKIKFYYVRRGNLVIFSHFNNKTKMIHCMYF